ncbi:hypothetical protein TNCV_3018591 [Trichonephila clavipes]|nr:hypothetical protein TNCV_3018591 [Trichonephila clavipes]
MKIHPDKTRSYVQGKHCPDLQLTPNHILECPTVATKLLKLVMIPLRDSLREILYTSDAPRIAEAVIKTFDGIYHYNIVTVKRHAVKTEPQKNATEKKTDDVFPEAPSSQKNQQEKETLLKNSKMRLRSRNLNNIDKEHSNLDKNFTEGKETASKSASKGVKKLTKKTTKGTSRNSSSEKETDGGKKNISKKNIEGSVKNSNEFHNDEEGTYSDSTLVSSTESMKDDEQPSCSNAFVKRNKKTKKKERRSGKGSNARASSSGLVKANEYLTNSTADNSMDTVWSDEDEHEGYAYRPTGAPPPTPPADRFDVLSVFKMCDRIQNSYNPISAQYANDPAVAEAYRYNFI